MKSPEHDFFLVNHDQHAELLRAVMPDSRKAEVTEAWVTDLDELLVESDVMLETKRTRVGRTHIRDLRASFEDTMGVDDPDSALHRTYQAIKLSYHHTGLHPCNVISNLLELAEIGGSVENGIRLLRKGSNIMTGTPKGLATAHAHIQHLAHACRWEGNVLQLLLDVPNLLRMGVPRRAFIGRMAMTYGSPDLRHMDNDGIKQTFLKTSVDDYLMALMSQGENYRFEETPRLTIRTHYKKRLIYEKLAEPEIIECIGPKILQAYFRYYRPNSHRIERYPHLAKLLGEEILEEHG